VLKKAKGAPTAAPPLLRKRESQKKWLPGQWPVDKAKALKPLPKKRSGVGWVGGISALFLRPEVIAHLLCGFVWCAF
jgi:hypothetical protein